MWPGHQFQAFLNSQTEHKGMTIQEEQKKNLRNIIFAQIVRLKYFFKELLTLIERSIEKLQNLGQLAGMGNRVQNILNNRLNSYLRLYN